MNLAGPHRGAHPRVLVAAAEQQFGGPAVLAWCERLIAGREHEDDPDLENPHPRVRAASERALARMRADRFRP